MKGKKRRIGRPKRRAASKAALAGVDLSTLDPVTVLRSIAADSSAPAAARVTAARALLTHGRRGQRQQPPPEDNAGDAVSRHALRILRGGKE
jgi:hypothetical protein